MSADLLPQEVVDDIVDNVPGIVDDQEVLRTLLSVSPTFRIRAQYYIFQSIDIGRGLEREELEYRLQLLADLIEQSSRSLRSNSIGLLIHSFHLVVEEGAAPESPVDAPTSLTVILAALASPDSNLCTMFLGLCHVHYRFSKPFWDAYFSVTRAPKLVNVGTYNLPLGMSLLDTAIEKLYCRTTGRHLEGNEDWKESDLTLRDKCIFQRLTGISIAASQLMRVMGHREWSQRSFPTIEQATVYVDARDGIIAAENFLNASSKTLLFLHLDFTRDKFTDSSLPDFQTFDISSFKKLAELTLTYFALDGFPNAEPRRTLSHFLNIVNKTLVRDPSNPKPSALRNVIIDCGWSVSSGDIRKDIYPEDDEMWNAFDVALCTLIRMQPNQPPKIFLTPG